MKQTDFLAQGVVLELGKPLGTLNHVGACILGRGRPAYGLPPKRPTICGLEGKNRPCLVSRELPTDRSVKTELFIMYS